MARPSDAKSRFIATAADLFRRRGYHGVGLSEVIEISGAPKGSFYHHFPGGKEELAEAAIALAVAGLTRVIDRAFAEAVDFPDGLRRFTHAVSEILVSSGWQAGCPVTAIALTAVPESERLHVAVHAALETLLQRIIAEAERLGETGALRPRVLRFFAALEGAWILARIQRSTEPFQTVLDGV